MHYKANGTSQTSSQNRFLAFMLSVLSIGWGTVGAAVRWVSNLGHDLGSRGRSLSTAGSAINSRSIVLWTTSTGGRWASVPVKAAGLICLLACPSAASAQYVVLIIHQQPLPQPFFPQPSLALVGEHQQFSPWPTMPQAAAGWGLQPSAARYFTSATFHHAPTAPWGHANGYGAMPAVREYREVTHASTVATSFPPAGLLPYRAPLRSFLCPSRSN